MDNYVDLVVKNKVTDIQNGNNVHDIGKVIKVDNYIIEITGLNSISFFEEVNINNKALGYVTNIKKDTIIVALLKINSPVIVGDVVFAMEREFMANISPSAVGKVIDIFGNDLLINKKFQDLNLIPVENDNIPIMHRSAVKRPLLTGIIGIDLIYPIGRGQRQLIVGDKKTGKTQIGLDMIANQKGQNMICIYVAVGKTKKEVKEIYHELLKRGAMKYTLIIAATDDENPPVLTQTPYVALSVAELFMKVKYDVLVVIDDLKRHAEAYRELSLLSAKTPGRDAYPADIFYTHSRLLEKGCQYKNGGSISIIPIMETTGGDITDYISTNVISITDGQIVMSTKNFQKGIKPAIDYGLSVSRLGGAVQTKEIKALGAIVRRKLLNYLETKEVYELANADEMGEEHKKKMENGKRILDNLIQPKFDGITLKEIIKKFEFVKEEEKTTEVKEEKTEEEKTEEEKLSEEVLTE